MASFGSNPYFRSASVYGGEATYPDPEPFDYLSEVGGSTWSDLLDGQGTVSIDFVILGGTFDWMYINYGSAVLDIASLVVEGTVVPEPATLIIFCAGIIALRRKNFKSHLK